MTGVDIAPQPRYCGDVFHVADALRFVSDNRTMLRERFVFVHASPPCQRYSRAQKLQGREHPDLIAPTRDALLELGLPFVIENVEAAATELRSPVMLCGASFGLRTYRHRLFEAHGWTMTAPPHQPHVAKLAKLGARPKPGEFVHYVGHFSGVADARADMGMEWANQDGLRECIPPAYAEHIGRQFLAGRVALAA